ncbi:protein CUSTOS [Phyllostomus discolor]|uniref:Protein CUSTOS n=1 Tax=Phyllostomus discolor TaxID=89673 RepID=A0A6J2MVN5_9CHIR|nr:protein CUSTOS [Phyllostomus discolor]
MSDLESSSSGSDVEELARCREAAMPAWGLQQLPRGPEKKRTDAVNSQLPSTQPSLRQKVDEHEQDGNELQTTPEFRAHVAKKLGALLDSSITISEAVKEPTKAEARKVPPEDDGFRLFFTSIPEGPEEKAAPQPRRKRLPSSSSSEDSDEERQRCREAAVSASDILRQSAIHGPVTVEKEAKKKKSSKKKAKKEASADSTTATATTTSKATVGKQEKDSTKFNGDVSLGTKKKKKKKKAKKASEASPCPLSRGAAVTPVN